MVTSLPSPPSFNQSSNNPLTHFVHNILSLDGNIMLAAIISLLLVILFVLLLHVYAKWFLGQARYNHNSRRNSSSSVSIPGVLGSRFHHFHTFTIDTTIPDSTPTKGLEPSIISSLPLFVFKEDKHGLECVICLTVFEEEEVGRKLPKCGHAFHVECIDMWLHSHSTCPICRASVVGDDGKILETSTSSNTSIEENDHQGSESVVEIIVENPSADHNRQNLIVASSSSASSLQVYNDALLNFKGVLERG
ncbi:RING-H2 finger protein ATL63 [Heracleum sosnowskyi]|uniref:RING-H2 finger protein ATL63 n=1 Tax=Heracleum sosnowskyi TaxID=360622 RepID=A0AAD8HX72_9APIA|nr:RING-H2 finger protein ATL63 [Heracleum sosnowskyi]